jgi:hydrogenase-4 component E
VERAAELSLLLVLITDFAVLMTDRLSACIRILAAQGVLLGLLPLVVLPLSVHSAALAVGTLVVKAMVLPASLLWAIREAAVRRERNPSIGTIGALLLGSAAVAVAFGVATRLPALATQADPLLVPASLATLMMGLIVLTTRSKALSQVVGYLLLENGVYLFGLTLAGRVSLLVETGVLLDVFVGVFIMGLVVFRINRELDSIDSERLAELTD